MLGLRDYRKVAALSHWVRCNRLSIVCLQETYLDNNDMAVLNQHFPSASVYLPPGSSHSSGVVTIVSDSLTSSLAYASPDGRLLSVRDSYDTLQLSVMNVYSPNALVQRLAFLNDISKLLDDPTAGQSSSPSQHWKHVLCGDLNEVLDPHRDRRSLTVRVYPESATRLLNTVVNQHDLEDTYRRCHPATPSYT